MDKVLPYLEAKQYAVEAPLLQSLQQFLQWCADLSLKLLAILPDLRHSRAPGVSHHFCALLGFTIDTNGIQFKEILLIWIVSLVI